MPIYEFECEECKAEFEELFRGASEKRTVSCPECGSKHTRKMFSAFATSSGGGGEDLPGKCRSCPSADCQFAGG